MAKKEFSSIGDRVKATIEQSTTPKKQKPTATPEEAAERQKNLNTQGKKDCEDIRINMAFTPENHEFIKVMAKASGRTMTQFTNLVIAAYREEHPEFLAGAKGFLDFINTGAFTDDGKLKTKK